MKMPVLQFPILLVYRKDLRWHLRAWGIGGLDVLAREEIAADKILAYKLIDSGNIKFEECLL